MLIARCPNCRVPTNGGLYMQCANRRQCLRCRRHLSDGLYEGNAEICKTCIRKEGATHANLNAFGGMCRESHLATTTGDVDLATFVKDKTPAIRSHVQDGIDQHE